MNEKALANYSNPDNDPRGLWKSDPAHTQGGHGTKSQFYTLIAPNGKRHELPSGRCWVYTEGKMQKEISEGRIWFGQDGNGVPRIKTYLDAKERGLTPETILFAENCSTNEKAKNDIKELFDGISVFETPKPVELIKHLLDISIKNGIVMDFFSGCASTAEAVIKKNFSEGNNIKFILVQLSETTDEKSEAYKAGYKNICEIGKERIRRAGNKIKEMIRTECDSLCLQVERMEKAKPSSSAELFGPSTQRAMFEDAFKVNAQPLKDRIDELEAKLVRLDSGFRVLKLDSSNMEDVYYSPEMFDEGKLFEDNVKPDRTGEDLLFQVMLECNLPLSAKIQTEKIAGKDVFSVNNGYLIACFDEDVNEEVITAVAKRKPYYFIMRDKSLSSDNVADNFEQIFQAYSKDTIRRII